MTERLISAAIRRNGEIYAGAKTHAGIRRSLRDEDPYLSKRGDQEGFYTSEGRFLSRRDAIAVGVAAGQLSGRWLDYECVLTSDNVNWHDRPEAAEKRRPSRLAQARRGYHGGIKL